MAPSFISMVPLFFYVIFTFLFDKLSQIIQTISKYLNPQDPLPLSPIIPRLYNPTDDLHELFPIGYDQPIYYPQPPPYAHLPGTIIYNGNSGYWQYRLVTLDTYPSMPDDGVRSNWGYLYTSWTRPRLQYVTQPPPSLQPPLDPLSSTPIPPSFFEDWR